MKPYRDVVLEHFRRPRNRGPLNEADVSIEGANPLCGDRVRIEMRLVEGRITEMTFTADACILCVASASLLTEHVRGMTAADAERIADSVAFTLVGEVAPARRRCATLPLDTMRRGLAQRRMAS